MRHRVVILAVVAMSLALSALAEEPETRWHSVAAAPRIGLPDVDVFFGYPGAYVPTENMPIEMRAKPLTRFDGYIGYHFAVGRNSTGDTPVVSRALLAPRQQWGFRTYALQTEREWWRRSPAARELVVEWRNAAMSVVAQRSLGVPPWSAFRPLLIVPRPGGAVRRLGTTAYTAAPQDLSGVASWYAGFSDVVVPLSQWLDLPSATREAIVGSGRRIAFSGLARPGQQLSALDRALLPVEFTPGSASYAVPWPYRGAGSVATSPVSWKPRAGASSVGGPGMPALVFTPAAAWTPVDDFLEEPLPAPDTERYLGVRFEPVSYHWSASRFLSGTRVLAIAILALIAAIVAWLAVRRMPRPSFILLIAAAGMLLLGARNWVRPPSGVREWEGIRDLGGGLVSREVVQVQFGASPLKERAASPELLRTARFIDAAGGERAVEIRSAGAAPGFGAVFQPLTGYDSVQRRWSRRELAARPSIRVVSSGPGRLVFDYESPIVVDSASAFWFAGGRSWTGEVELPLGRSGRATIRNSVILPRPDAVVSDLWSGRQDATEVHLYRETTAKSTELAWSATERAPELKAKGFFVRSSMTRTPDGAFTCSFAFPPGMVPSRPDAAMHTYGDFLVASATASSRSGTFKLRNEWPYTTRTQLFARGNGLFAIPAEVIADAASGGVVMFTIRPQGDVPAVDGGRLSISFAGPPTAAAEKARGLRKPAGEKKR